MNQTQTNKATETQATLFNKVAKITEKIQDLEAKFNRKTFANMVNEDIDRTIELENLATKIEKLTEQRNAIHNKATHFGDDL